MNDREAEAELRAVLTRASEQEARRQSARDRQDWPAMAEAERELARLYRRHAELEQQQQRVA